jgi:hypothetical protein
MTPPPPKSRTRRPALTDPEWWTSLAVNLFDAKPGSLAKDLAKLLKKDRQSVPDELLSLVSVQGVRSRRRLEAGR